MAAVLTVGAIGGLGFLYFQIAEVTEKNSEIQNNLARYKSEQAGLEGTIARLLKQKRDADSQLKLSQVRLDAVNDNSRIATIELAEVRSQLNENRAAVSNLKKKEQAAKSLIDQAERAQVLFDNLSSRNISLQRSIDKDSNLKNDFEIDIVQLKIKLEDLIDKEEKTASRVKDLMSDEDRLRSETSRLKDDREEIFRLGKDRSRLADEIKNLRITVETQQRLNGQLLSDILANTTTNDELKAKLANDKPLQETLSADVDRLYSEKRELEGNLAGLKELESSLKDRKRELGNEIANLELRVRGVLSDILANTTTNDELKAKLAKDKPLQEMLSADVDRLYSEKRELEGNLAGLKELESSLKDRERELANAIADLELRVRGVIDENKELNEKRVNLLTDVNKAKGNLSKVNSEVTQLEIELQTTRENLASENGRLGTLREIIFQRKTELNLDIGPINEDVLNSISPIAADD